MCLEVGGEITRILWKGNTEARGEGFWSTGRPGDPGFGGSTRLAPPVGVKSQPAKAVARSQLLPEHQPEALKPSQGTQGAAEGQPIRGTAVGGGVPGRGTHSCHSWGRGPLSKSRRPEQNATSLLPSEVPLLPKAASVPGPGRVSLGLKCWERASWPRLRSPGGWARVPMSSRREKGTRGNGSLPDNPVSVDFDGSVKKKKKSPHKLSKCHKLINC